MKHLTLTGAVVLILAGCSSGDQTANNILDVVQKSDLLSKAKSVRCDPGAKTRGVLFREKCWTRNVSEADIETIGTDAMALGLALQKASPSAFLIVENNQDDPKLMLMRENTQDNCAYHILIYFEPQQNYTEPYTMRIEVGVTEKPYCGALDLNVARKA